MGDISVAAGGALVLRSFPFLLLRLAVYLGIAAAFAVAAIGGAGIGAALGTLAGAEVRTPGSFWGGIGGLVFVVLLVRRLSEYLLFLVETGHAAAIALILYPAKPSATQGRVAAAMTVLQRRFRDAAALSTAHRLTRGTIADLMVSYDALAAVLPDNIRFPTHFSAWPLQRVLGFVGKTILARAVRGSARNPYSDLRATLVLLAQNHALLLRDAMLLAALGLLGSVAIFLVAILPAFALMRGLPGAGLLTVLLAGAFAWCIRQALIEPLLLGCFFERFIRATSGQQPEPDWDARLAGISMPYREIAALAAPAAQSRRRGTLA